MYLVFLNMLNEFHSAGGEEEGTTLEQEKSTPGIIEFIISVCVFMSVCVSCLCVCLCVCLSPPLSLSPCLSVYLYICL